MGGVSYHWYRFAKKSPQGQSFWKIKLIESGLETARSEKVLIESLDGVDWSNPQDLKDIIETKVTEVATSEGVEASDLTAYFSE